GVRRRRPLRRQERRRAGRALSPVRCRARLGGAAVQMVEGRMMTTSATPPGELIEVSARIGEDIDLVQGAGGNSAVKVREVLWVKASGTGLSAAREQPIFLPLDLGVIHREVAAGADDPIAPALLGGEPAGGLRPSIETSLHALLPHRLVLHVHSVNLI